MIYPTLYERVASIILDLLFLTIPIGLTFTLGLAGGAVFLCYALVFLFLSKNNGQTPGKMIMKLKVVNEDGTKLETRDIIGRMFAYMFSLIFGIGYIFIFLNKRHLAMHDFFSKTCVVKK